MLNFNSFDDAIFCIPKKKKHSPWSRSYKIFIWFCVVSANMAAACKIQKILQSFKCRCFKHHLRTYEQGVAYFLSLLFFPKTFTIIFLNFNLFFKKNHFNADWWTNYQNHLQNAFNKTKILFLKNDRIFSKFFICINICFCSHVIIIPKSYILHAK